MKEDVQHSLQEFATVIEGYTPSAAAANLVQHTSIVFLVGIAGSGKDTIQSKLLESGHYRRIITHTTRQPRYNHGVLERNGLEYHFIDLARAWQMLQRREYLEANIFSGNVYGTSVSEIQYTHDQGKIGLTDIDVNGVAHYMQMSPNIKPVFVLPPNFDTWQQRFLQRYGGKVTDPQDFKQRMQTAIQELQQALVAPYYYFVINDDLATCVQQVAAIADAQVRPQADPQARAVAEMLLTDLQGHLSSRAIL